MENPPTEIMPAPRPGRSPAPERRRSLVGPILLIGLGLLFLGENLGLLPGGVWATLWRLWPLLLVLVGIELIFGRSSWGATIGILALVLTLAAFAAAMAFVGELGRWSFEDWSRGAVGTGGVERVSEELGDVRQATIDLRHGAGRISVAALPDDSTLLLDAELSHGQNTTIERNVDRRGSQASVRLRCRTERNRFPFGDSFREDWAIQLSRRVPMELQVRTGASEVRLELSDLAVTKLDVDAGASSLKITLPRAAGLTSARIKAGAAAVEVTVPEGVAARIRARGGLSGTSIDQSRFPQTGSYYQSPDYGSARKRVDMEVETGVSSLTIR